MKELSFPSVRPEMSEQSMRKKREYNPEEIIDKYMAEYFFLFY